MRTRGRFTGFAEEMWSMLRGSLVVFILLYSWVSHGSASVTYDKRSFIINGQRKILISGSIHYPRSTPEVPCFKCQCGFYVFMGFSLDFFFFFFFNFFFFLWVLLGIRNCRCGQTWYRRPKMEAWMLYRLMCFGMGMSRLVERWMQSISSSLAFDRIGCLVADKG